MTPFEGDIQSIVNEIVRVAAENHTGEVNIKLHMNQGGISRINFQIDKNLKSTQKRVA